MVKEIKELDIVVSLPRKQFGYVSITEISPIVSKLVEDYAGGIKEGEDEDETSDMEQDEKVSSRQ
jgi:hypothetical protein